jgi:hypothetical protein
MVVSPKSRICGLAAYNSQAASRKFGREDKGLVPRTVFLNKA